MITSLHNLPAFADQDAWINAYAHWYRHFLAMQTQDRLTVSWAREMTEASLGMSFFQRDDQKVIAQIGIERGTSKKSLPSATPMQGENSLPGATTIPRANSVQEATDTIRGAGAPTAKELNPVQETKPIIRSPIKKQAPTQQMALF